MVFYKLSIIFVFVLPLISCIHAAREALIIYTFSENGKGEGHEQQQNFKFFLDFAVYTDDYLHYCFIINGNMSTNTTVALQRFQSYKNVEVMRRENFGYDFCAWKQALKKYNESSPFFYFFLINSSVRGPFLPSYVNVRTWPLLLTNLLKGNVRLVGTTINCFGHVLSRAGLHIQSMLLLFTFQDLELVQKNLVCLENKWSGVVASEIGISQAILNDKGNLAVTQLFWRDHDFLDHEQTDRKCRSIGGDIYFHNAVKNISLHPLELLFMKTNRGVSASAINLYTEWQYAARNSTSF